MWTEIGVAAGVAVAGAGILLVIRNWRWKEPESPPTTWNWPRSVLEQANQRANRRALARKRSEVDESEDL